MTDYEKYLFDLRGYLTVPDVLGSQELTALNELVDAQTEELVLDSRRLHTGGALTWGQPFVDLLDHPRILPLLGFILGDGFRLDHYYTIFLDQGADKLRLHGGNRPYDPPEYYHFRNDRMYNGLTVVAWNLADTGPDHGGFCCVPGSHKANYRLPDEVRECHEQSECVVVPEAPAGSVVIFTEALTHGTAPWTAAHQRRSLLFKYSPGQQSWGRGYAEPPPGVTLTERQRLLFEKPYFNDRPTLFADSPGG